MAAGDIGTDLRSISDAFNSIDKLTEESEFVNEITKKHWKPSENAAQCSNRSCRKQFSFLERHHHCRKCGDLFCAACLLYKRRLNLLAHYDPQGQLYKVCQQCYEDGQSVDGCTRSISPEFIQLRQQYKNLEASRERGKMKRGLGWRNRVNFDLECKRLMDGFKSSVGKSELTRTLHEMQRMMSMPEWHKSSTWLQETTQTACQNCYEAFGLLRKRHHCKICGLAVCKSCSTTDLLIYIGDEDMQAAMANATSVNTKGVEPIMAIIKIVGCPEVEPELSLYLRVCTACREEIIRRQLERLSDEEAPTGMDLLAELSTLHSKFSVAEINVNKQLKDYQEIVDSLENNSRRSSCVSSSGSSAVTNRSVTRSMPQSNMQTLAKAQEDLTDFLAQHVMVVQRLKRLVPKTETQSRLLKSYIRAKCDFYMENMSTFRQMKRKLSESSPPEVLEFIQRIMDKNSIISAHLYLRQLVYETIHLCEKYGLQEQSVKLLFYLEQVIEKDVSICLQKEGEDVDQHLQLMKEMIRTQMKEHKLIHLSRRAMSQRSLVQLQQIVDKRTREILDQVTLQLKLKSANRSFPATKQTLVQTSQQL